MVGMVGRKIGAMSLAILVSGVLLSPAYVLGGDKDKDKDKACVDAKAAFARLKTMAGTWKSDAEDAGKEHHGADNKVTYRLTGGGSALVETMLPGSDHEMVSVYHLDGEDLRMTHYCAIGNQPRLKLDRANSTPDKLIFTFDGGTNLDPAKDMHIHAMTMTFDKDGKVNCAWESNAGGKKAGTHVFRLSKSAH